MATQEEVNEAVRDAKAAVAQRIRRMAEDPDYVQEAEMNALANAFAALNGQPPRSGVVS